MAKSGASWTDIKSPTKKDLNWLRTKFRVHPVILEELKGPSARAHVETYDHYLFLVYYFPIYDPADQTSKRTEIDFIITRDAVVTVHYEEIDALNDFKDRARESSFRLVYDIIEYLLLFQDRQLRHVREKVEEVGKELFRDREREILKRISHLKRDVSEYRIVVGHQGPILRSLGDKGLAFWGEKSRAYLNDLIGDHLKLVNQLEDYREAISDFEDSNNQMMNLKINEVMKTFTTLSFLTFPFMLLAALFSMNTKGTPLVDYPGSFWIIFGAMVVGMVSLLTYFKKKGWL